MKDDGDGPGSVGSGLWVDCCCSWVVWLRELGIDEDEVVVVYLRDRVWCWFPLQTGGATHSWPLRAAGGLGW